MLLIAEVAETSLERDRQVKLPAYARAGVPEVWLLDLPGDRLEAFRDPAPEGYRHVRGLERGNECRRSHVPRSSSP